MKTTPLASRRFVPVKALVFAFAVFPVLSDAAPARPDSAPAAQQEPVKKSFFQRVKSKFTRDAAPEPAAAPAPVAARRAEARPAQPVEAAPKKGFFQRVKSKFTREPEAAPVPAPVARAAKPEARPAAPPAPVVEEKKPGFFSRIGGAFRRDKPEEATAPVMEATPPVKAAPTPQVAGQKEAGFFRRMMSPFSRGEDAAAAAPQAGQGERQLAAAKTHQPGEVEPEKKTSFFARMKQRLTGVDPAQAELADVTAAKRELPKDWEQHSIVTEVGAAFYHFGPNQPGGADEWLPRGTALKVLSRQGGWARVQLAGGQTGLIGQDQLRRAEIADFAAKEKPKTLLAASSSSSAPSAWAPMAPPPDLPESGLGPDANGALLLLPPLEGELDPIDTLRSHEKLKPISADPPVLQPGDALAPALLTPATESPAPDLLEEIVLPEPPAPAPAADSETPANP